jgi:hypothetical protein
MKNSPIMDEEAMRQKILEKQILMFQRASNSLKRLSC